MIALGWLVHWMAATYAAARSTLAHGIAIVTYTATPFFIAGVLGLHPALWFDITVGVVIACRCLYLLYVGVPIVMQSARTRLSVRERDHRARAGRHRRGDGCTALLWDVGAEPVFTY